MSSTDRINRLLLAEDWRKIYQSFRNAEFKSYDFDTLRRTMIQYLRQNYPEDFNDYLDSSEYLALIDLIAFLGQNLAFRIDLNARENFIDLAERRESVLRLARLISYNAKRNQCANGLLKVESVTTTEDIIDSNNVNLANQSVIWNDPSNEDWLEQFTKIINAALPSTSKIGNPTKTDTVGNILTELYALNSVISTVPTFSFNKSVSGRNTRFEVVSADLEDGSIQELTPQPGNRLHLISKDDGRGFGSTNNGYFLHFRQGTLNQGDFVVDLSQPNQVVSIDAVNVNQTDVWLYQLDSNGNETTLWNKIDATAGNNVIYNSSSKNIRNIYSVITRIDDRINLQFADGTFGNLPKGAFRIYYRTSDNRQIKISPADLGTVEIDVPYLSALNRVETLTISLTLPIIVDNATNSESSASIRVNAPTTFYTQNRLITAEDYNVGPMSVNQEIIKIKSVNRVSSGISRYYDLIDATGKYSNTNLFGNDGVIYRENINQGFNFTYDTRTEISGIINNKIEPILSDKTLLNFYLANFPARQVITDIDVNWSLATDSTNLSTGCVIDDDANKLTVGTYTQSVLKYLQVGSILKFVAPSGKYFTEAGTLANGTASQLGESSFRWATVTKVIDNGTQIQTDLSGPIYLNDFIPSGAVLDSIIPKFVKSLPSDVKLQMVDQIFADNSFGLRYDVNDREWSVIDENNLNVYGNFSQGKTGDISNQQLDASWLILFTTDEETYTVTYRTTRYVFESDKEIRFYYDSSDKNYNATSGRIVKDKISVLSINTVPGGTSAMLNNVDWQIIEEYRDAQGYVDSKKIVISFFDSDDDGIMDNPLSFELIALETSYIFQKKQTSSLGVEDYVYVDQNDEQIIIITNSNQIGSYTSYEVDTVFYNSNTDAFLLLDVSASTLTSTIDYKAHVGRSELKFQYVHSADSETRIDPSSSNFIDIFMLTRAYDTEFRLWLSGAVEEQPKPPSSDALFQNFGADIAQVKSISDELVYHPVKYKVLFGPQADKKFQATFKVVKNPNQVVNDDDIKVRVVDAINQFFALENWDFGETFYFSELSAYVMNVLAPDIVTFLIVPDQTEQSFGSLYEIKSESEEIFISGAEVMNIQIIDAVTASKLRASGTVITATSSSSAGILSSANTSSSNTGSY